MFLAIQRYSVRYFLKIPYIDSQMFPLLHGLLTILKKSYSDILSSKKFKHIALANEKNSRENLNSNMDFILKYFTSTFQCMCCFLLTSILHCYLLTFITYFTYVSRNTSKTRSIYDVTSFLLTILRTLHGTTFSVETWCWATL